MVGWCWQGRDRSGRLNAGVIDARDRNMARAKLRAGGWVILRLARCRVPRHLRARAISWMVRQLATLLKAGVPLAQALESMAREPANQRLLPVLAALRRQVEAGLSFSEALENYPRLFDGCFCQAVAAGELSGMLDLTLERLALEREKRLRLAARVRSALMYPLSVLLMAGVLAGVMVAMVIPAFKETFAAFGHALPAATRWVIALSDGALEYGGTCLAAMTVVLVLLALAWRRFVLLRLALDHLLLAMPLLGRVVRQAVLARWVRTLALLFAAGVPLCEALASAGAGAGNQVYQAATHALQERIRAGMSLHDALQAGGCFPGLLLQIAAVGEESGALDTLLLRVAEYYEDEVDQALLTLTGVLEPLSMALLGGLCGVLIWALYLPVFELGSVVA